MKESYNLKYFKEEKSYKYKDIKDFYIKNDFNVIEIDFKNIDSEFQLFQLFEEKLIFPSYFGRNWDAFYDCITDLSWLKNRKICILINNIDFIKQIRFSEIFFDAILDSRNFWLKKKIGFEIILFTDHIEKNDKSLLFLNNLENRFESKYKKKFFK